MLGTIAVVVLATGLAIAPQARFAPTPCENLKSISLVNGAITAAESVADGDSDGNGRPSLPAHCRVTAVLRPSSDSLINMELWLPPADKWNGKFQAVGNGEWAGSIQGLASAMPAALRLGYATAGNDTGHVGNNAQFALGHPEKVVDFAYRAMHEMTVQSKVIIDAFYGRGPRLSYYNGCSTGGRQGLMAAQRYPRDFDGIIVGAPVHDFIDSQAGAMARQIFILQDPEGFIPETKQIVLAKAVKNACDALDGVIDNLIAHPPACSFDPASLLCKSGDGADCLTAKQVATAKRLYTPTTTSNGELLSPGRSLGGELTYTVMRGGSVPGAGTWDMFRYIAHQDPNWDWKNFNVDADPALAKQNAGFIQAVDPDLTAFKANGGKLILYQGWADSQVTPESIINYHSSVLAKMGPNQDDWLKLFMVPGMGHCRGGNGPNQIDWIGTLEKWRENEQSPFSIIGRGTNAGVPMTRPLCPHPQVATYKGTGDPNDAANFSCKAP